MRQVWITKFGPPEVLQMKEAPDPTPGPGEVRIRVRASGVNFAELMARLGFYPDAPKGPFVPGYEVAGTIDALGDGVRDRSIGQRVLGMPKFGGYADTLIVPVDQSAPMPDGMSFEEGAALPVVYLTAHHAMLFTGNLRGGSTVLIHSAAGGVGLAAIQLARARKCRILGTASTEKHEFLRAEGVQHPLDSRGDVPAQVRAAVGERAVDLILDPVGGRSWKDGYALLAPAGRLVMFGASNLVGGEQRSLLRAIRTVLAMPRFAPMSLMRENRTVSGVNMGHMFERQDLVLPQLAALLDLYRAGTIKPHVDRTFPLAEAAAAHHYLHSRKAKGKVVLVP
jgi:NADPH:quinone reductase-like Zn-dependent oxidoreductase